MNCDFCKEYKQLKEIDDTYRFTVAIVRDKQKGGRITQYKSRGVGYRLKYCPSCGKELK